MSGRFVRPLGDEPRLRLSRSALLQRLPRAAAVSRLLGARWAGLGVLGVVLAGCAWIVIKRFYPVDGPARLLYWLHDTLLLPLWGWLWHAAGAISLTWLVPAGVFLAVGLAGYASNRSILRALQRGTLIRTLPPARLAVLHLRLLQRLQSRFRSILYATAVAESEAVKAVETVRLRALSGAPVPAEDVARALGRSLLAHDLAAARRHPARQADAARLLHHAVVCADIAGTNGDLAAIAGPLAAVVTRLRTVVLTLPGKAALADAAEAAFAAAGSQDAATGEGLPARLPASLSMLFNRYAAQVERGLHTSVAAANRMVLPEQVDSIGWTCALLCAVGILQRRGDAAQLSTFAEDIFRLGVALDAEGRHDPGDASAAALAEAIAAVDPLFLMRGVGDRSKNVGSSSIWHHWGRAAATGPGAAP